MSETVTIIDYGSGNLRSAAKAFARAAGDAGLSTRIVVTADPAAVAAADRVVLPGVGAFGDCAAGLRAIPGMEAALTEVVIEKHRPFFGICVGMQLMATRGLEHGSYRGFDWIPGEVRLMEPADAALKIPHIGWNTLAITAQEHPVLRAVLPAIQNAGDEAHQPHAYFVHSYAFVAQDPAHVLATTAYGGTVTAMIGRDNLIGAQFHPEKSQAFGLALIAAFLRWRP